MNYKTEIEKLLPQDKSSVIGFGDCLGLLHEKYNGYRYCISIGIKLDKDIIDRIETGPTIEYNTHYKDINNRLGKTADDITLFLSSQNINALAIKPTVTDQNLNESYQKDLRTDFSHKMAATRAGIGWIGKTDLLVSLKFGPRLRLATVLLDRNISPSAKPIDESNCKSCNRCVSACPANAANGKLWNKATDRDEFYNAFACRNMCKEITKKNLGFETTICGICISVCPIGKE